MYKPRTALLTGILLGALFSSTGAVRAGTSFQQAVGLYNAGKYSQALGEFKRFSASYPTNGLSHYYLALCYQSLGSRAEARQEFTLTSRYGDASLNAYAQKALKSMAASSGSAGVTTASTATTATAANDSAKAMGMAALASQQNSSVSEVLEFYTDWCHVCKEFEPVWSATQGKVQGVQFHRYNAEDSSNATLVQKYNVHAYPTLVYLDKSGKVLKNAAGCPLSSADFVQVIRNPL